MRNLLFVFALVISCTELFGAFAPAPADAVKELKVAKGKPFSSGVVFVNGKFVEPPYVVERYGNVIRINKIQVTGPVCDWNEFLKVQTGASVSEVLVKPGAEEPAIVGRLSENQSVLPGDWDPLDSLFEEEEAGKPKKAVKKAAPKKKTVVSFDGAFVMNDKATELLKKINAKRTEIDIALRKGGFYCFGSSYSRVSGDSETAQKILSQLPEIMRQHTDLEPFNAAIRKAGLVFFPPQLVKELLASRTDYPVIQKWCKKVLEEKQLNSMLEKAGESSY